MARQDWNTYFMNIAKLVSTRSTCMDKQVGCVLTRDNFLISCGYNGTPSKYVHCCDYWENKYDDVEHSKWSKEHEIHAEMNAILTAARHGISIENCILYTTYTPCVECAKAIVSSKIQKVYYDYGYKAEGLLFLFENRISCVRLLPSSFSVGLENIQVKEPKKRKVEFISRERTENEMEKENQEGDIELSEEFNSLKRQLLNYLKNY